MRPVTLQHEMSDAMRFAVTAAATLGAAALIAGMGTVSAQAAGSSVVTPNACENFTHPDNSSATYLTNTGTKNMYTGADTTCGVTGYLNPGNIFSAYCWHGNAAGQEWIYGLNSSTGKAGWVYAPSIVKVSGTLNPCNH